MGLGEDMKSRTPSFLCILPHALKIHMLSHALSRADLSASTADESSSLLYPGRIGKPSEKQTKLVKALLYAVQVFYSFFIM